MVHNPGGDLLLGGGGQPNLKLLAKVSDVAN